MGIDTAPYTAYDLLQACGTVISESSVSLEDFTRFCEKFPDLIAERTATGKVIIISPVKSASSENESHLFGYLYAWNLINDKPNRNG